MYSSTFPRIISSNSIFHNLFNDIFYVIIIQKVSLTYTKFHVSDGNSFSQCFRKFYHWITLFKTCFFHMKEIVKKQFDNHLLVKMVLRVDEFFLWTVSSFSCVLPLIIPCKIFFTKLNFHSCVPDVVYFFCVCVFFYFSKKSLSWELQYGRCVRGFWRRILFYTLLTHSAVLKCSNVFYWKLKNGEMWNRFECHRGRNGSLKDKMYLSLTWNGSCDLCILDNKPHWAIFGQANSIHAKEISCLCIKLDP